jgi:hypothetical protein
MSPVATGKRKGFQKEKQSKMIRKKRGEEREG